MEQVSGSRILLAEEDAATRRRLTRILNRDDLDVEAINRPEDLLQEAKATVPDLVIVDVRMPAGSGFDLVRKLRRGHPNLPILALVSAKGGATVEQALKAIRLGATDFLQKPIDAMLFLRRVQQCLSTVEHITSARPKVRQIPAKLGVVLLQLHDPDSGRVDAKRVADYLSVPLAKLAPALGVKYRTLFKTPSAESVQESLRLIKRVLTILDDMIGDRQTVRAWLNAPHADLGMRTPIQVILGGHVDALLRILENALEGIPA
jgi:FixJ family two-component response regulator